MSPAEVIAAAIGKRLKLTLVYDGHARVVEPHTFGVDKHGREILCGYQTAGTSTSGKPVGWKFFLVAKICELRTTADRFASPRPRYQHNDGAFLRIIAQL